MFGLQEELNKEEQMEKGDSHSELLEVTDEMCSDDINEKQYLLAYWRCDEGRGNQI